MGAQLGAYRSVQHLVGHVSWKDDHLALLLLELPDDHALLAQRPHVVVVQPLVAGQQKVHQRGSLRVLSGELPLQVKLYVVIVLGMYGCPQRRLALR